MQFQIDVAGRVTHASVLRQKGQTGTVLRRYYAPILRFPAGRVDRVGYMVFVAGVRQEDMPRVLKGLERAAAEEAKAAPSGR